LGAARPTLLKEGRYVASEGTMHRLLADRHGRVQPRDLRMDRPVPRAPQLAEALIGHAVDQQ